MAQGPPSEMLCTFGNEQGYPYPVGYKSSTDTMAKLYGSGYLPLLLLRRREAHHMPGLQERTAGATTTATEYHEKEQTAGLHVQASAGAHTNMPTAHQI